jgi:ribose/xylose/arabinose/galactoside ABC-type transport system permease subunit
VNGPPRFTRSPAFGPLLGLVAAWVLFAVCAGGDFTALANQRLMLLQTAVVGTAAIGATIVIASGGIDLSVGSSVALGTVLGALVLRAGGPVWLAALTCVLTGCGAGLLLGTLVVGRIAASSALVLGVIGAFFAARSSTSAALVVLALALLASFLLARHKARLPLSPFIVTLGAWGALRGLAEGLGDNQPVYPASTGWIGELLGGGSALPPGVWILLVLAGLAAIFLRDTVLGRHIYAVGSNEETARLCGVDLERTRMAVYVIGVGLAGVAALLQLSYLSMGDPTTAGGLELRAIAAAVIGGASLAGGSGSILGTLFGALLMTVVDNGCTKLGLDNWVQEIVTGGIILAAVALDRARAKAQA